MRPVQNNALVGMGIVIVLVSLVGLGLYFWHTPAPPHISAYTAGCDRGILRCGPR